MTRYEISWGYDPHIVRFVESVNELDVVLDEATQSQDEDGLHFVIDLVDPDRKQGEIDIPLGLHFGIGPGYAKVIWTGPGENIGFESGIEPYGGVLPEFDYGGVPTEETPGTLRVSPAAAREAAREFVESGQRPTCLEWASS